MTAEADLGEGKHHDLNQIKKDLVKLEEVSIME